MSLAARITLTTRAGALHGAMALPSRRTLWVLRTQLPPPPPSPPVPTPPEPAMAGVATTASPAHAAATAAGRSRRRERGVFGFTVRFLLLLPTGLADGLALKELRPH